MISEDLHDIFEPFERFVEIEIGGEKYSVPENNSLLRCFQFLSMRSISGGEFCWNGDCLNCLVQIKNGADEKSAIACRTTVEENMKITKLSGAIKFD